MTKGNPRIRKELNLPDKRHPPFIEGLGVPAGKTARDFQTRPGQARTRQPGHARPHQARPSQARPGQVRSGQARPGQADLARLGHTMPGHERLA